MTFGEQLTLALRQAKSDVEALQIVKQTILDYQKSGGIVPAYAAHNLRKEEQDVITRHDPRHRQCKFYYGRCAIDLTYRHSYRTHSTHNQHNNTIYVDDHGKQLEIGIRECALFEPSSSAKVKVDKWTLAKIASDLKLAAN